MGRVLSGTARTGDELAAIHWEHTTGTFRAMGHRFAVRSTHAGIGRFVENAYAACASPTESPGTWYSILHDHGDRDPHALYVDAEPVLRSPVPAPILNHLTWHVNQRAIELSGDRVLLHAAAAAWGDLGIILPGPKDSGKTTLVAGLVKAGFRYLTDEATSIDPASLRLHPYPKPLSIDPGSWQVHADLEPDTDTDTARYIRDQWQVAPERIRADAVSGPVGASLAVFPRYEPGADMLLQPLRRSAAVVTILEQTFRFHAAGRRNLQVVARLIERMHCYRLVCGDLPTAVAEVTRLVRAAGSTERVEGAAR
jgi:hypothetical protein